MKESEKLILEFSRQQYDYELQQQSTLNNYISIPIGIVTVVAGSLSFLFTDPPVWWSGRVFFFFFLFYVLAVLMIVCLIVFIFLHQTGLKYYRVPSPQQVKDYHDQITASNPSLPDLEKYTADEIQDLIYDEYRKGAEINFNNNIKKGNYYRIIKALLVVAVSLTVISYGIYNFVEKPAKVSKIHIENLKEIKMTENNNEGTTAGIPATQAPSEQIPVVPVVVQRPLGRLITESINPTDLFQKDDSDTTK